MEIIIILVISIILQIVNIIFVLTLVRLSGFKMAWWIFSAGLIMRAGRNILFLLDIGQQQLNTSRLIEEVLGCAISFFFLIGTFKLKPIFEYYQKIIDELKESREKYRVIIKGSQDGILIVQSGKIKFVNPKLASMFGYTEKEILEKDFLDFVDPSFKEMIENKYKERISGRIRPEDQYDLAILNKDGTSLPVEATVSLIQFAGSPASLAIIRNAVHRKKTEEEKQEISEELVRINQTLVGRELKMLELKKEIENLKAQLKK